MKQDNIIIEPRELNYRDTGAAFNRFKNISLEYFQLDLAREQDNLTIIKENAKFFSFQLPIEFGDYFIDLRTAPLFWITDNPLLFFIDDYFKAHMSKGNGLENQGDIKNYYSRWALVQSKEEKKYFANSAVKLLEKNVSRHNFLHLIFHAVILGWEESLLDYEKALHLLTKSKEKAAGLKINDTKKEEFQYLINIFSGFIHLRQYDYSGSQEMFRHALEIKPSGISAVFYSAYAALKTGDLIKAAELLRKVFEYDVRRSAFAIESSNLDTFNYFCLNSTFSRFFNYTDFTSIIDDIEELINEKKAEGEEKVQLLKRQVRNFLELRFEGEPAAIIGGNVKFIETILTAYSGLKNIFYFSAAPKLEEKFKAVILGIESSIKKKYAREIEERMEIYDLEISEKTSTAETLKKEMDEILAKMKDKLQDELRALEQKINTDTGILEDRIKHLHMEASLDPVNSFKNTMTYNFILAVMVFLIGAFAGYSTSSAFGSSELNSMMSVIMLNGIKWSLLSFLIGLLISVIVSGSVVLERGNVKQRLMQRITILKTRKEQQTEALKTDAKLREERITSIQNKKIADITDLVENIRKEKEKQRLEMQQAFDERIKIETEMLRPFLAG